MAEQVGDRLAIVGSSDGFCKDHGDVNHLQRQEMYQVKYAGTEFAGPSAA